MSCMRSHMSEEAFVTASSFLAPGLPPSERDDTPTTSNSTVQDDDWHVHGKRARRADPSGSGSPGHRMQGPGRPGDPPSKPAPAVGKRPPSLPARSTQAPPSHVHGSAHASAKRGSSQRTKPDTGSSAQRARPPVDIPPSDLDSPVDTLQRSSSGQHPTLQRMHANPEARLSESVPLSRRQGARGQAHEPPPMIFRQYTFPLAQSFRFSDGVAVPVPLEKEV